MTNEHFLHRYNKMMDYYKSVLVEGYVEKHHIIPKCMGGSDDISNLVALPPRAHFIAHALLHKAYPNHTGLAQAFAMMVVNSPNSNRNLNSKSKLYALAREARSNALKGVPLPEWVKEKMRKPKSCTKNYKKPKSEEHSKNISNALKKRFEEHGHHAKGRRWINNGIEAKMIGKDSPIPTGSNWVDYAILF